MVKDAKLKIEYYQIDGLPQIGHLIHFKNKKINQIFEIENVFESEQPDHIKYLIFFADRCLPSKSIDGSISGGDPITVKLKLFVDDKEISTYDKLYDLIDIAKVNDTIFNNCGFCKIELKDDEIVFL